MVPDAPAPRKLHTCRCDRALRACSAPVPLVYARRMITLDEARHLASRSISALEPVEIALTHAGGLRLAAPVVADVDLPPGAVSAMDGYAARAGELDGGRPMPVAFEIQAGQVSEPLPLGQVARIFTGALLPEGADCVVPQEHVTPHEGAAAPAVVLPETRAGACVRARGEVFQSGEIVLPRGTPLGPHAIALAAAAGAATLRAVPRPRVSLVTSGGELVATGETPGAAEIRDSNTPMLAALAEDARLAVVGTHRAKDTLAALVLALERALATAELVVTTGGVSVGDYDLVPSAAAELGGAVVFHGVAMRPGKPIYLAHVRGRLLLGLPGNPVSALVGWRMIGRPAAEALAGDARAFDETPLPALPTELIENPGPRLLLRPARLRVTPVGLQVAPSSWRGSHDVRGVAHTNALVRLEPGARSGPGGDPVGCYPLPWQWTASNGETE